MGKFPTFENFWLDQNGHEIKNIKVFSSCPKDEGHVHMSSWPRKCGPIDLRISQHEYVVIQFAFIQVGFQENILCFAFVLDMLENGMWRLERLGVQVLSIVSYIET